MYSEEEFDKHDEQLTRVVEDIRTLVDAAESKSSEIIDKHYYSTAHMWREVAEKALELANLEEWFDRYEDKEVKKYD